MQQKTMGQKYLAEAAENVNKFALWKIACGELEHVYHMRKFLNKLKMQQKKR